MKVLQLMARQTVGSSFTTEKAGLEMLWVEAADREVLCANRHAFLLKGQRYLG